MPYVVYEQPDGKEINSYSCPIVAGYSGCRAERRQSFDPARLADRFVP